MPEYGDHFEQVAPKYDALRREATDEVADWLVAAGHLQDAGRLLDVGCGTGAMTRLLARRLGIAAVGIDPSDEMLRVAGAESDERCRFVQGRAEQLPFEDGSFDRALMQTVVHLLDRPVALAEAHRVLADGGALVVATVDPAGIDAFWLAEWFPSWSEIDRRRFPPPDSLTKELETAGFGEVEISHRPRLLELTRDHALAMLRARFASSFALIEEREYERGVARAEREMPERFESTLELVCLTARA
ncbi:MAG TPA: methyltransferase domain-containing protein [Thermoleophilaceae bacterium]|nr:methyltransferase domain-containing protein [Thermoleophilaceae bacterium]